MPEESKERADETSNSYRYYVLALLTLTYFFSIVDRNIFSILSEDIKAELDLTDTQLGLLMGFAFAVFYSLAGIPVARLADRTSRKGVIAGSIAIWSVATGFCGLATGFVSMFAARSVVGVGEAGAAPPAHAIITDLFPRKQLTRALSIFLLGATLGSVGGQVLGGILGQMFGWRATFWIVALPGVVLGLIIMWTVREPPRGRYDRGYDAKRPIDSVGSTLAVLMRNRAYVGAILSQIFSSATAYGLLFWIAPLLIRNFDLEKDEVGLMVGGAILLGGLPGLLLGGQLTDYLISRNYKWVVRVPATALLVAAPTFVLALFCDTPTATVILFGLGFFFFNLAFAPPYTIVQTQVEPHQRALASAVSLVVITIFGMGAMLPFVGWLSDTFASTYGDRSINLSLAIGCVFLIVAAASLLWALKGLRPELINSDHDNQEPS
jgi:predicted MFS family arabinose efflux permease